MKGTDRQREPDRDDYKTFERLPQVLYGTCAVLIVVIAVWLGVLWVL